VSRNVRLSIGFLVGTVWCACSPENGGDAPVATGGTQPTTGGQAPSSGGISTGGTAPSTGGTNSTGGVGTSGGTSGGGSGQGGISAGGTGGSDTGGAGSGGGNAGGSTGGGGTSGGSGGKSGSGGQGNAGRGGQASGGSSGGKGSAGSNTGGNGTGGSTGGNSTGGVTSTPCNLTGSPNPGSGSFTYYYFGQGTYKDPNSGKYQTACGYLGTGNGMTDTVENIAGPTYFVAIPGQNSSNFENNKYCGGCVQLSNGGNSVIATVIDECPHDSNPLCTNGHLDVSKSAFDRLGYNVGNPSNTTWKFVPCPVMGNVKVRVKNGNPNEIYIENAILALQSVTMDGAQANRQSYGAWHFNGNIAAGAQLVLTDVVGRTITVTVANTTPGQNQDTGKQFPTCQ
jgi:hypothetical protein